MSFLEVQFPTNISVGSKGGPRWRTVVTQTISGWEQRLQKWEDVKSVYDVGYGVRNTSDLQTVVEFFNQTRGMAYGFRYKDWLDYSVTDEPLTPTAGPTIQLAKTYGTGLNNYTRDIKKPTSGSVTMELNSSPLAGISVDTATGVVTFTAIATGTITAITQANPGQVTDVGHGRTTGDQLYITDAGTMAQLEGQVVTITVLDPDTFTIGVDTTSYTAFSGTGQWDYYPQTTDNLTWSGEYDIPVRFADDYLDVTLLTDDIGSTSIPLEEIRL